MGLGFSTTVVGRTDPPRGKPSASSGRKAVRLRKEPARLPKPTVPHNRAAGSSTRLVARAVCFCEGLLGEDRGGSCTAILRGYGSAIAAPTWMPDGVCLLCPSHCGKRHETLNIKTRKSRRGIIAVLSAVLFIVMLAMVAFAVDVGYMDVVRTQLQASADSAALAAAGSSNLYDTLAWPKLPRGLHSTIRWRDGR